MAKGCVDDCSSDLECAVLAESSETVVVEGNHYFPRADVRADLFSESTTHTHCGWKGDASYYNVEVDGETNADAAWFYPEPMEGAEAVTDRVAFWHGVEVEEVASS